jgi:hypothetical protein
VVQLGGICCAAGDWVCCAGGRADRSSLAVPMTTFAVVIVVLMALMLATWEE